MAYDPMEYRRAKAQIVGSAMQSVGSIAATTAQAIGEVAQQKIDMRKFTQEDYPKILATATDVLESEYGISRPKAATLAARMYPSPSTFESAKKAKEFYITQTGRIDEFGAKYSERQEAKAQKAKTEAGRVGAQRVLSQYPLGTPTPQGSAAAVPQAPQVQSPTFPPVGGATAPQVPGQVWAPEEKAAELPAEQPQGFVPQGSAAAMSGRPTQAALMGSAGDLDTREALSKDPAFQYYPKDEDAIYEKELGKAGDLLKLALVKAETRKTLGEAAAAAAKAPAGSRAGGAGDTEKELDRLEGRVKQFQGKIDNLTRQIQIDQKKLDDMLALGGPITDFDKQQRKVLESSIREKESEIKTTEKALDRADDTYVTNARSEGIDLDFVKKIPRQYLDQAAQIVAGLDEAKDKGAFQSEQGYMGRLVLSAQQAVKGLTGKQMTPEDIARTMATLMDKHRMTADEAIASLMDYAVQKFGGASNTIPMKRESYE